MRPPNYLRAPVKTSLVGICLLGVTLLLTACVSQQAGINTGGETPSVEVSPTVPAFTPTPYPTATTTPLIGTPNATATAAALAGCSTPYPDLYFEKPPGPLQTTIPFPPATLVENYGRGINGISAMYYFCTPRATRAGIMAYLESALPAAGWTRNSAGACNLPSDLWYKGQYGIEIVVDGFSLPMWALDMYYLSRSGCSP
jgi:hypothetical protein